MRLAVIGCGKQGRRHLAAVAGLPGIGSLIAADENAARAADASAAVGALAVPAAEIFDGDADAVVIATPTATHLDLARRAIDAGKHVLCEKPFGGEPAAAQILADEAARRGLVGRVGYLYRFAPAIASARAGLAAIGAIGEARFAIAAPGNHAAWKHRRDEGGGAINELASHMVDLALWFFGAAACETREIGRARAARRIGGERVAADAEDRIVARLGKCVIEADFAAPRFAQSLAIRGTHGALRASIEGAPDLYRIQAQSFLAAIAGGARDDSCDFAEAARVSAILCAMRRMPPAP